MITLQSKIQWKHSVYFQRTLSMCVQYEGGDISCLPVAHCDSTSHCISNPIYLSSCCFFSAVLSYLAVIVHVIVHNAVSSLQLLHAVRSLEFPCVWCWQRFPCWHGCTVWSVIYWRICEARCFSSSGVALHHKRAPETACYMQLMAHYTTTKRRETEQHVRGIISLIYPLAQAIFCKGNWWKEVTVEVCVS